LQTKNYTLPHQVKTTTARLFPGCSLANSYTPAKHLANKRHYRQQLKIGVSGQQNAETKHQNIFSWMQRLAHRSPCSQY